MSGAAGTSITKLRTRPRAGMKHGKKKRPIPDQVKKYVKTQVSRKLETKVLDDVSNFIQPDYAGIADELWVKVTQGSGNGQREGNTLQPVGLEFRGNLALADTTNLFRLVLFTWQESTTPTASQIFQGTGTANVLTDPIEWSTRGVLTLHYDKVFTLGPASSNIRHIQFYIPGYKIPKPIYETGGGVVKNKLFLWCFSDSGAAGHPGMAYSIRLLYKDG